MRKHLVLLIFLILFSGCVSQQPAATPLTEESSVQENAAAQEIENVRSSLQAALASGGISPETYAEVDTKITNLETQGYDTSELRSMLSQLNVGGQAQDKPVSDIQATSTPSGSIPVLKNLGVNFGEWNPATNRAGDFLFMQGTFDEQIIVPFGYLVINDNGAKRLPEMTFILPVGTPVVSPIDGIVFNINTIEWSQDYAVHLKTDKDEEWMVSFEHLINLRVSMGDRISAGQVVGEAAPWNSGTGFAEIVVWKGGQSESDILKHCPFDALEDELKPSYAEKISSLVADWEKFKGKNIYEEEKWTLPGCLLLEMTEIEAMNPAASENVAQPAAQTQPTQGIVRWEYADNTVYMPSRTPPDCPELIFDSPVDVSKATSILYPGQYRGIDYKPHGGFRFDGSISSIEVRAPFDGYVTGGVRYIENGDLQYSFDFMNECGIAYRFDHLFELSPGMQNLADSLPPPKVDDTRGTSIEPFFVRKGDLIATKIGEAGNVFVDWGVYDLRKENSASQNPAYRTEHNDERHHAFHALCWLDYLPEPDRTTVKNLPGSGSEGKTSDYC